MNKHQKYKKWVVDDLLKNTLVETYSTTINFTTPKGILQRRDDVSFYDETIQVYYGIPDDYSIISEIENAYREILVDMYYEYDKIEEPIEPIEILQKEEEKSVRNLSPNRPVLYPESYYGKNNKDKDNDDKIKELEERNLELKKENKLLIKELKKIKELIEELINCPKIEILFGL